MKQLKRYALLILALAILLIAFVWDKQVGLTALTTIKDSGKEMLLILPPVFILLGLLDVWVPRETMVKYMGEGSGILGGILAFMIGSAAAGPLYVAFPIAAAFMKKDVKFSNILILIGAWSSTKIPMLMFEYSSLGPRFMIPRLLLNVVVILLMTLIIDKSFSKKEKDAIIDNAKRMS
jgi:uncharacterized membrane protein YraQ (UPF0718 family)